MKTFALVALIASFFAILGYGLNLPQDVGLDVPEGKLNSLSFAPFREGQGPLQGIFPSAAEMDLDLQLMAKKTHTIRTYASAEGTMPAIPDLARKQGLTMLQGAWLGGNAEDNNREIAELIRSANAHPDVVKRVIVGNEVLLRGDLKPEQLVEYIRQVQRAVKQPVSYADVWSMYMKYPQLIKEVDFVTIHILPYWEDEPIAVEAAPAHIERIYKQVQKEAYSMVPNIPILIGESGWPSAGRQRGYAIPSVVNEAKFIRGFIKVANANGFDYNIVEAINQSWKSELEGVVGANWGLYSVDREEVFPLTGSVYEHPEWLKTVLISLGVFLLAVICCWKPLHALPTVYQFGFLVLLQLMIVLAVKQVGFLWYTSYSDWQRLQSLVIIAFSGLMGSMLLHRIYYQLTQRTYPQQWGTWLYYGLFIFTGFAIFKTLGLATNGRYISFPSNSAAVLIVGLVGLMLANLLTNAVKARGSLGINRLTGFAINRRDWDRMLGYLLLMSAILLVIGETQAFVVARDFIKDYPVFTDRLMIGALFTLSNAQLLTWLACLGVLAIPFWISGHQAVE